MSAQTSECDIVVVGAGPCGLFFSACLARLGYKITQIGKRPEPTHADRADGIQPCSFEVMSTKGLEDAIMNNGLGRIKSVVFWDSYDIGSGISRTVAWTGWSESIRSRFPFTSTLHQRLIEKVFIRDLEKRGVTVEQVSARYLLSGEGVCHQGIGGQGRREDCDTFVAIEGVSCRTHSTFKEYGCF